MWVLLNSIILGTLYSSQGSCNLTVIWKMSEFNNQTVKFRSSLAPPNYDCSEWRSSPAEMFIQKTLPHFTGTIVKIYTCRNTLWPLFLPSLLAKWCVCMSVTKTDGQKVQHCLLVFFQYLRGGDDLQVSSNLNYSVILWILNKNQCTENRRYLESFSQSGGKMKRLSDSKVSSRMGCRETTG